VARFKSLLATAISTSESSSRMSLNDIGSSKPFTASASMAMAGPTICLNPCGSVLTFAYPLFTSITSCIH
jgi:hypothetical protein